MWAILLGARGISVTLSEKILLVAEQGEPEAESGLPAVMGQLLAQRPDRPGYRTGFQSSV
jgi:hypothetical protein